MSKISNIRWSKKDRQNVSKTVSKFNAKITRTIKKHPELADYMPDRLSSKELQATIKTRKDLNRMMKSFNRFMKKGAELPVMSKEGAKTTAWEKRETAIKVATINRKRTFERKKADVSTFKGTMGTIEQNNLRPKKMKFEKLTSKEWDLFTKQVEKESMARYREEMNEKYKENYIQSILNVYGSENEGANAFIEKLKNVDAETLIQAFYDDPVLQIDFIYDPLDADMKLNQASEHLDAYLQ